MASLDELIKKLEANNMTRYTPLTQQQMQQQAAARFGSVYDQQRLNAQQKYDTADQALAQQLAGLDEQYAKQLKQSAENYETAYRAADRQSLGRGMQRSSYNSATLGNISLQGAEAQQAIRDTQAAQARNIGEQRKLLSDQFGATIAGLNAAQQSDILAYIDELEAREYERARADQAMQNDIAMNLYQYQFQKEQADQDQANWMKTFNAQYSGVGGGSGSTPKPNRSNAPTDDDFINALNKSASNTTTHANETDVRVLGNSTKNKVNPNRKVVSVSKY